MKSVDALIAFRSVAGRAEGSVLGRQLWTIVLLALAFFLIAPGVLWQAYTSDRDAAVPWDIVVRGSFDKASMATLDKQLHKGQRVSYAAFGDFSKVSSDMVTIGADEEEDSEDKEVELSKSYLFLGGLSGADSVQSYQPLNESSEGSKPWFSDDQLVMGTVLSQDALVIDAYTAATLGVSVGDPLKLSVKVGKKKVTQTARVTEIVRPTDRFIGISTALPAVSQALLDQGLPLASSAYVYGVSDESKDEVARQLADNLGDSFTVEMATPQAANRDNNNHWDIEGPSMLAYVIAVLAILLSIALVVFDQIRTIEAFREDDAGMTKRAFSLVCAARTVIVVIAACALGLLATYAWIIPTNIFYNWLTFSLAVPFAGLSCLCILVLIIVQGIVAARRA